jgi:hypothetical protein
VETGGGDRPGGQYPGGVRAAAAGAPGPGGQGFHPQRSDFDDAVIIGRLTAELRCYVPYLPEGPWARLRHLGARRAELLVRATAARQGLRDLLECA